MRKNIILSIAFVVLLILFFIFNFLLKKIDERGVVNTQNNTESGTSTVLVTPIVVATTSVTETTNTTPIAPAVTTNEALYPLCKSTDLEGSFNLQNTSNGVTGTVTFKVRPESTCSINSRAQVLLQNNKGNIEGIKVSSNSMQQIVNLKGSDQTRFTFLWTNWCGSTQNSLQARVMLGNDAGGYLLLPAVSQSGIRQAITPSCTDQTALSTITVMPFSKL